MAKHKSQLRKRIEGLNNIITKHQEKIRDAWETGKNLQYIEKWEKEIENFNNQIMELTLKNCSKKK